MGNTFKVCTAATQHHLLTLHNHQALLTWSVTVCANSVAYHTAQISLWRVNIAQNCRAASESSPGHCSMTWLLHLHADVHALADI